MKGVIAMEITIYDHTYKNCYFVLGKYAADNSLAIRIFNDTFGAIATITKCLVDHSLSDEYAFIDENNVPGIKNWILEHGFGRMYGIKSSGWCKYPLIKFDLEKLKENAREF